MKNIQIYQQLEGARAARGLTVIIDVFRAFTVECMLCANGAAQILPVGSSRAAYEYREAHPDALLIGERRGVMLPGFDYGNSPSQIEHADFTGKTLVHTTSAGTQGIANAIHAEEILTGALVNAAAIAKYINSSPINEISLVCMGLDGTQESPEDTLCAEYIKALALGMHPDISAEANALRYSGGAKFFDPAQSSIFPERDFHLSIRRDVYDFVLKVEPYADDFFIAQKIALPMHPQASRV